MVCQKNLVLFKMGENLLKFSSFSSPDEIPRNTIMTSTHRICRKISKVSKIITSRQIIVEENGFQENEANFHGFQPCRTSDAHLILHYLMQNYCHKVISIISNYIHVLLTLVKHLTASLVTSFFKDSLKKESQVKFSTSLKIFICTKNAKLKLEKC